MIKQLLDNTLTQVNKDYMSFDSQFTQDFLRSLDRALINNEDGIGLPYWADQNPKILKAITFTLVSLNYATVKATRNYSRLSFNTALLNKEHVALYRRNSKLSAYTMREDTKEYPADLVASNGKRTTTGLVREGFTKAAKASFKYDVDMLMKYHDAIKLTLIKSMRKAKELGKLKDKYFNDEANYEQVVQYCLNSYMLDGTYNLEANTSDSRGRSIFKALKRVGNPVSSKDFRALLVAPATLVTRYSTDKLNDIYYFIAELLGAKATTETTKIAQGKRWYNIRKVPILELFARKEVLKEINTKHITPLLLKELIPFVKKTNRTAHEITKVLEVLTAELSTGLSTTSIAELIYAEYNRAEHDREELHELIWLERIYTALDEVYTKGLTRWEIPLEVDASMSIAQIVGALSNEHRLLERTNVIGTKLTDPWYIEGVRRIAAKSVGTPVFYGSSQSAVSLIKSKGLAIDNEEVKAIRKEFSQGGLAIMKKFKDAIIKNYTNHQPVIEVKIWNDTFNIEVNKFKPAGARIIVTEAWNGKRYVKSFTHQPILVPNYTRMKLFWATCLVHNLDSQIMNNIVNNSDDWMITIHDAALCLPGVASEVRKQYALQLKAVNSNRHSILKEFRNSIGATTIKADIAFMKLYQATEQAEDIPFNAQAMK